MPSQLNKNPRIVFDQKLKGFPYQLAALESLIDLDYSAVFFEQGLGKTKIAIDLAIEWLRTETVDTVIVVTKKGLIHNWLREIEIHSYLMPKVISSDRVSNHRVLFSRCQFFVANYEAIALEEQKITEIAKIRQIAMILDESQKIKNPKSKLVQSFFNLSEHMKRRVIMTGTPVANRPYDLWAQIYFLDRGESLGKNFDHFKKRLDIPKDGIQAEYWDLLVKTFGKVANFTIRETKKRSGLDLPGKIIRNIEAKWETQQRALYLQIKLELRATIVRGGKQIEDTSENLLKRLLRLVQVTSNPRILDESYMEEPGKLTALKKVLKKIDSQHEKAIIWTSFIENCTFLRSELGKDKSVIINGKMNIEERNKSVVKFMDEDMVRYLIATPQAAKEGLTLTAANHAIFFDRSFSLDDYLQSQDRIHRISQKHTCFIYNLVLRDSIDEWIEPLIELKTLAAQATMGDAVSKTLRDYDHNLSKILEEVLAP